MQESKNNKLKIIYEIFIALLAFAAVLITLLDLTDKISPEWLNYIHHIDIAILIIFGTDYFVRLILAKDKKRFFKDNIFDLIALIPFNSIFRAFRLVRLAQVLRLLKLIRIFTFSRRFFSKFKAFMKTNGFAYVLCFTFIIVILGAFTIYLVEFSNSKKSFYDALWWSFVTVTTVGYGDISPATNLGRLIASILMLLGIGFIGMVTGTIATFFLDKNKETVIVEDKKIDVSDLNDEEMNQVITFIEFLRSKRG